MTQINSKELLIDASSTSLHNFFGNLNNLEKIMPPQVINWESSEESCSFTIKNTASLSMQMADKSNPNKIIVKDVDGKPFKFELIFSINESSELSSNVKISFNADLNMTLKLLAVKPLENFLNLLVDNLKKISTEI